MGYYNPEEIKYCGIDKWHRAGFTGKGIKVGFIDDLPARERNFIRVPFRYYTVDETGHGDYTMDILHQVAPDAVLYSLPRGAAATKKYDVLKWIAQEGISIINVSQSGTLFPDEDNNIDFLAAHNVKIFGASGNHANREGDIPEFLWLKNDKVTAVGAVHLKNTHRDKNGDFGYFDKPEIADYSVGRAGYVDCVGFSKLYLSRTFYEDNPRYGTSYACPWIAGMCALYDQWYKEAYGRAASVTEFRAFLASHCEDLGTPGVDAKHGHGLFILPDPKPAEPPKSEPDKVYRVQVGAFTVRANAVRLLAKLKARGYDGFIV